ncbi:MAG: protein translocase subunit SecF, partial [Candidatus Omnitrophica bacterium]|nr:protein translocase subunit SecF [Candidatus Omnitrophota bacterium]
EEASLLARALRSGALPTDMHVEEERTIGPLLGKDSIEAGIKATLIGGILLFIFMAVYYLTAGVVSSISLAINLLLIVGSMGFLNAMSPGSPLTLTLPGIAGIILTLGMAVDANVLINERIREELDNNAPLQGAINSGFSKALKAIVDSNVTTLIAAFMLFQFGSGPIKGFAITLSLGLLCSLFSALYVTKTLFQVLVTLKTLKSLPMMRLLTNVNFDFVSKRYICFVISGILVIGSAVAIIQKKDDAYGIDFAGGQIQEYKFTPPITSDELRDVLKGIGLGDAIIQQFEQYPGNVIIRTADDTFNQVQQALNAKYSEGAYEVLRIEKVGPIVGKALRKAALLAIICALGGILLFVGFRFKHFDFATAGVIALLHDVFVTLGLVVFLGRQIDLLVVTALLTIAGYSINDTIIIYDRVRENIQKRNRYDLKDVINLSVNQTLGRTILTTLTTLLVVVTLYLKGGEVLNTFALCLLIGFVLGTYSTIFIASPLVLAWDKRKS